MLVGHASTLDACSRQLVGGLPRNARELSRVVQRVPYCSLCVVEQMEEPEEPTELEGSATLDESDHCQPRFDSKTTKIEWKLIEPPVPPMTYTGNARFDWQIMHT